MHAAIRGHQMKLSARNVIPGTVSARRRVALPAGGRQ